jgi:hypothetical protein
MGRLTRTERRLRSEVMDIAVIAEMDVWNIETYRPSWRKHLLEVTKDKIVRSEVVFRYTFIDELLTDVICDYYFHRARGANYRQLWRTKHFRIFVHFIMDETFLLKKLAMVEQITKVPTSVSNCIKRINDVRNALAHSLFPQNRRRYMTDKRVVYSGSHLFSVGGLKKFQEDYEIARAFLAPKVFR